MMTAVKCKQRGSRARMPDFWSPIGTYGAFITLDMSLTSPSLIGVYFPGQWYKLVVCNRKYYTNESVENDKEWVQIELFKHHVLNDTEIEGGKDHNQKEIIFRHFPKLLLPLSFNSSLINRFNQVRLHLRG